MLRRPPTTIQITAEDIAAYEDRRAGEALHAAQQARAAEAAARAVSASAEATGSNAGAGGGAGAGEAATRQTTAAMGGLGLGAQAMEGVLDDGERTRRTREERIGVGRRAR
ncbi:hypothetical protein MKX08_009114 [Trichoderma sp. CBMAI-0020]|nr:hypothetical protein MKX08_009114 [Trichoderma sp. CBMAI-0020]